jgi:UDP-GlcNAc:undecaprenyl-phosphate GlcNAc-1-phosphate transferase
MKIILILTCFIILNLFFILNFKKIRLFHQIIDYPNKKRKFHKNPVSQAGGIILILNLTLYLIFMSFNQELLINEILFDNKLELFFFGCICFLIFIIGLIDDKYDLRPILKLILIILTITFYLLLNRENLIDNINFSFFDKKIIFENFSLIFTIFCFVVFLNSFNMFDGINLQAGLYSAIIILNLIFFFTNSLFLYFLLIYIFSFLFLNYKNECFLGDNGSLLISFILSFIFIKFYNKEIIVYSDEVLICMLIPGIDMIRLFFERIKNKKSPFSNDRKHIHHLFLNRFSFKTTSISIFSLIFISILLSRLFMNNLFIICFFLTIYIYLIKYLKKFS